MQKQRVIVELDVPTIDQAIDLVRQLREGAAAFKIGLELQSNQGGPQAIELVSKAGGLIFYDGKFDDIPTTVGAASKAVADAGVWMFNLHASASFDSMLAAASNKGGAFAVAVTVLTSMSEEEAFLNFGKPSKAAVLQFARNAKLARLDGIVCSPIELPILANRPELKDFLKMTPGVRPAGTDKQDQKRVMTPGEAIAAGADYLVIGRPITQAPDPAAALDAINAEVNEVLPGKPAKVAIPELPRGY